MHACAEEWATQSRERETLKFKLNVNSAERSPTGAHAHAQYYDT